LLNAHHSKSGMLPSNTSTVTSLEIAVVHTTLGLHILQAYPLGIVFCGDIQKTGPMPGLLS